MLAIIQQTILRNPQIGPVMPATSGLRKLRVQDTNKSRGKRGGLRVIYLDIAEIQKTYLLSIFCKNEADDLSFAEKKGLRKLVLILKKEARHE